MLVPKEGRSCEEEDEGRVDAAGEAEETGGKALEVNVEGRGFFLWFCEDGGEKAKRIPLT